jgi:hypothetical protein
MFPGLDVLSFERMSQVASTAKHNQFDHILADSA